MVEEKSHLKFLKKNQFKSSIRLFLLLSLERKKVLPRRQKKNPVDFDSELKIEDVRYDNMTRITIKVQLFWRLPYET